MTTEEQPARSVLDEWLNRSASIELVFIGVQDESRLPTSLRLTGTVTELTDERLRIAFVNEPFLSLRIHLAGVEFKVSEAGPGPLDDLRSRHYLRFVTLGLSTDGTLFLGQPAR